MSPIPIDLAVEDALSEAVLRQVLERCGQEYAVAAAAMGTCEREYTAGMRLPRESLSCWSPTWIPRLAQVR